MTNRILDEYLARVRAELTGLSDVEREAVVDDMRGHLEHAIFERMERDPAADLDAVTLEETRAFGDPTEIAAARGSAPRDAPPAIRRRGIPRWVWALAALALLLLAAVVVADVIDRETRPEQVTPYSRHDLYANQTGSVNETFQVTPSTDVLSLSVLTRRDGGCLGVRVTGPNGAVVLDEWDSCASMSTR